MMSIESFPIRPPQMDDFTILSGVYLYKLKKPYSSNDDLKKKPYFPYITRKCCFYWGMNVPKDVMKYLYSNPRYLQWRKYLLFYRMYHAPRPWKSLQCGHREKGKFEP